MNSQNRKPLVILLVLQTIVTIAFGFGLATISISNFTIGGVSALIAGFVKYMPEFIILMTSLLPQFALLLKHKLHSQDGEILPLLFSISALQATMIIAEAVDANGYLMVFPAELLIVQRFAMIAAAAMFLLSSLRYYGFSSSNMSLYTFSFLAISFILSASVPMSSYRGEMSFSSSPYEIYLLLAITAIYAVAIITFIIIAVKDRTSLNVKRSVAFITMAIGLYICQFNLLLTAIASIILYVSGIIILVLNAGDSL